MTELANGERKQLVRRGPADEALDEVEENLFSGRIQPHGVVRTRRIDDLVCQPDRLGFTRMSAKNIVTIPMCRCRQDDDLSFPPCQGYTAGQKGTEGLQMFRQFRAVEPHLVGSGYPAAAF